VSLNKSGETPLHLACYGGHSTVVQWLMAAGAAVNALNEFDETPLLYAGEAQCSHIVTLLTCCRCNIMLTRCVHHANRKH
jgi:ankyrin repeat protein